MKGIYAKLFVIVYFVVLVFGGALVIWASFNIIDEIVIQETERQRKINNEKLEYCKCGAIKP